MPPAGSPVVLGFPPDACLVLGRDAVRRYGPGTPIIHFEQWERDEIEVKLVLKGVGLFLLGLAPYLSRVLDQAEAEGAAA